MLRQLRHVAALALVALTATACLTRQQAVPMPPPVPTQPAPVQAPPQSQSGSLIPPGVGGNTDALKLALGESTTVKYRLVVVIDTDGGDRTQYLDRLVAEQGQPAGDELLLVVFPKAGYDIRFAMGAIFRQKQVTVEELLGMVRSAYLPEVRKGDPAAGLAALVREVNRRVQ